MIECVARYNTEPWNIHNPNAWVTNNAAESLNAVIKRLLDWKGIPIDCICLSLIIYRHSTLQRSKRV